MENFTTLTGVAAVLMIIILVNWGQPALTPVPEAPVADMTVPPDSEFRMTDLVLQNPHGDLGTAQLLRNGEILYQFDLGSMSSANETGLVTTSTTRPSAPSALSIAGPAVSPTAAKPTTPTAAGWSATSGASWAGRCAIREFAGWAPAKARIYG